MNSKKWMLSLLTAVMSVSLISACSSNSSEKPSNSSNTGSANTGTNDSATKDPSTDPITITFFDKNTGDKFDNAIAKEITKRTGVTIEIQQPTGNPTEKLNLMLASDDLPDMIMFDRSSDLVAKYTEAGSIIPLDDLIEKYGPDVKEMYGDVLNKTRYKDGKNYYLSNWYGLEHEPVFGFNMRKDIVKELAPDKADGGVPFTQSEFKQLLTDFKAKYPQIDGKDTIALTMDGENWGGTLGTFKGMFGLMPYYEHDGKLQYDVKDPKYKDMILYMNDLYRSGLMDKEWAINKRQVWEQKIATGTIFSSTGAYWDLGNSNTILKKDKGEDSQLFAYKVVADGVDPSKTTYGGRSSLGWDAIAITKKNKNPERTMQFINFLASEEGQYLLMWGIEGVHWDMKDGKHVPRPETLQAFKDDWAAYTKETGIRKWTWFIKNGPGKDGTPYDLPGRYERAPVDQMAIKNLSDSVFDTAIYDGISPQGGTPEALSEQKISDITKQAITKAIMAPTAEEASTIFDKMLSDMKAAGDEKVEAVYTTNYEARKQLWN
ncbi:MULTISPECIES: ABC transporter substrate-binding protein [unclassified Paenibacillus]|uniref:ABC transporter substrate-binding protein n=1 Tax=unclassified Paenibacillus TaxID=185978 RepID=UPI0010472361|nr:MULTISPECIES: ABC transporter substrate-binding protein [unclassified Paenibacillus]NIK66730.1 putative aldouronate transport system substrate-binding protein [Paenibacillus sp. BK720]TCN00709.1 carbohydrate ABC transporter substrate-binding protein (CUT1 family) [Paenibacillus sp. BK033]